MNDGGTVLASQSYDPYGNPETSGQVGIFGYTGELQVLGAGNAEYLRARWYQPGTGTLLGVDPELGTTGQAYAYAGDDPVDGSDPTGLALGWDCDRGGARIDAGVPVGSSGLSAHDLAESAYLVQLQSFRGTCEFAIPASARSGSGLAGYADVVDNYQGNGANLWELEPIRALTSPGQVTRARGEADGYIVSARQFMAGAGLGFPSRQVTAGAARSYPLRQPGGLVGTTTWTGPRSFTRGSQQAFRSRTGGLGWYTPPSYEVGANGYLYTVIIGVIAVPGVHASAVGMDGVMWFLTLRSRFRESEQAGQSVAAPSAADIPYYLHEASSPPSHYIPWVAAADEMDEASAYQPAPWTTTDTVLGLGAVFIAGGIVCVAGVCQALAAGEGVAAAACIVTDLAERFAQDIEKAS
jgi:RHS repeat-associated protein